MTLLKPLAIAAMSIAMLAPAKAEDLFAQATLSGNVDFPIRLTVTNAGGIDYLRTTFRCTWNGGDAGGFFKTGIVAAHSTTSENFALVPADQPAGPIKCVAMEGNPSRKPLASYSAQELQELQDYFKRHP